MKLKTIVSVMATFAFTTLLSCAVFAAPHFEIGTPMDLSTGNDVASYDVGTVFAVPIDLYTDNTTDVVSNYSLSLKYDSNVVKPYGLDENTADNAIVDTYYSLGNNVGAAMNNSSALGGDTKVYGVHSFLNAAGRRVMGSATFTKTDSTSVCGYGALSTNSVVNNNYPVAYLFFEVTGEISDDSLNKELVWINPDAATGTTITISGKANAVMSGTIEKANACDGAFKIVVDGSSLPYWVQGVKVNDISLDACITADGSTEYSFPVRLIKSNADNTATTTEVTITATVTDDEAGTLNERTVNWGKVSVNVEGTATGYTRAESLTFAE